MTEAASPKPAPPQTERPTPKRLAELHRRQTSRKASKPDPSVQLSTSAAIRARDVAPIRQGDLDNAEKNLTIIRRNYLPPKSNRPQRTH